MGCGMQRSFILLLKGDVVDSFQMYPALIPIIGMLLFLIIHIKFKFENGGTWLKYMFIFNLAIIVISYSLKFLN